MKFPCHHCCRTNDVPDDQAGRTARCIHCRKLVTIPIDSSVAPSFPFQDANQDPSEVLPTDGPSLEFGSVAPAEAMLADRRHKGWQRIVSRIRVVLIVGAVAGATAGAALARGSSGDLETLGARAVGAFLGLLLGLSLGAVAGVLHAANPRPLAAIDTAEHLGDLVTAGQVPDVFQLLGVVLGFARLQRFHRLDAGDFVLFGVAAGAVLGAVVGANLAQQGFDMSKPDWLSLLVTAGGGTAGLTLMLAFVYFIWRPWRGFQEQSASADCGGTES